MRWLKEYLKWLRESLPIVEGWRIHFTKDSLILLAVVICALLTGFYLLGILTGMIF